ncbi:helix-turn-helix domain-containing protein [Streptomyces sp. YIM S03343]
MAETKLSALARRNQGVPSTSTQSGVIHIKEFQPDRYSIVGNHLSQHGELSLTAIGLGVHILSLPEGAPVDIRSLAARFTEGRDRIASALRELEAGGYVERVRERVAGGHVITRTYAYNAPEITRARDSFPQPVDGEGPSASAPDSVPEPAAEVVLTVVPDPSPDPDPVPEPPRGEHHDKAEALLVGLRRTDSRLMLSSADVRRLTPAAVAWFENGVGRADLLYALTYDLPPVLKHPAGFLAYRLREQLPPPPLPLPTSPDVPAEPTADTEPTPSYAIVDCSGWCNRVIRGPEGALCSDCRKLAAAMPLPPVPHQPKVAHMRRPTALGTAQAAHDRPQDAGRAELTIRPLHSAVRPSVSAGTRKTRCEDPAIKEEASPHG